jgi:phosphoribosylformylglycinamidine synthase subunit PurS
VKSFQVEVRVLPRRGILDPQAAAVQGALGSLGFREVTEVHVGRLLTLSLEAESDAAAEQRAAAMCRELLANPVTEDWSVRVTEGEHGGV